MSLFKKIRKFLDIKPVTFGYKPTDDLDTSNPPGKKFKHANTIPVCEYVFDERDYTTKDKVDPFGGWGNADMIYLKDIWGNRIARDYVHHYYHYRNEDNIKHNVSDEVIDYIERHLKMVWIEREEIGTSKRNRCAVSKNFGISYCKRTKPFGDDYIKALTLDLIFIHFAIEWIPDNTSENLNEPK